MRQIQSSAPLHISPQKWFIRKQCKRMHCCGAFKKAYAPSQAEGSSAVEDGQIQNSNFSLRAQKQIIKTMLL